MRRRGFDISTTYSSALANIDIETGTRATVLASRAAVTKQAIGEVVRELEERGFVTRESDPTDGRAKLIKLTVEGRKLIAAAYEVIGEIEEALLSHIGEENLRKSRESLAALTDIASRFAQS
ncbi:MAG: MarR family transcriptional regulator [Actinomycetota bacterium]|nr:MarR family transcriptional regulator [Actinomycetota bacterium]